MSRRIWVAIVLIFIGYGYGCGGGSSSDDSEVVVDANGTYQVAVTLKETNCRSRGEGEFLNGQTAVSHVVSTGEVALKLPGVKVTLTGEIRDGLLCVKGSYPLGGLGAMLVDGVWTYAGNQTFTVEYVTRSSFADNTSGCDSAYSGTAVMLKGVI